MLRIVVCVCFAAALARPEHDHARQEHDRARQRHDHRHDRRHELLPARSRDGVGMARGLIGPCGAIGIGNALDAYSSAFLEAAALDRRLVVQGRIYERLCALVTCGLAAAAPPGPADDVEDRNNCCFKWHGGRRVEDDLRPALARVLAALGCAIDGASRRSRDDAAGEALAFLEKRGKALRDGDGDYQAARSCTATGSRAARGSRDFWWRLLGATADWIFMARGASNKGHRRAGPAPPRSRTAGLRGNASLFSLFREAAGDGALPTACQWTRRDFY
ncbi:hypothetical protein JL722_11934 [Aureococcus anophagefferens]|nr:hypothetical protein JL722_11934 [Aureococcus anophagefferens]